ncbi:hypothetical protein [Alteromonas macleodii]|uniref:Integrase catalytic domain-containing protein n=1 Tax=Alteromonas macleodii TaxID=28108 RepID=A0A6T9Y920_ALTMA|nr:hypothetical protein [Alteromonas macleodii]CAB9494920.1 protein of unknown function [Alteromonas macleodii]
MAEFTGVFKTLYVDFTGILDGPKRCTFSKVQRAFEELGIETIFANSPQGKGRIERAFDTLQNKRVPNFYLCKTTDITSADAYPQHVLS